MTKTWLGGYSSADAKRFSLPTDKEVDKTGRHDAQNNIRLSKPESERCCRILEIDGDNWMRSSAAGYDECSSRERATSNSDLVHRNPEGFSGFRTPWFQFAFHPSTRLNYFRSVLSSMLHHQIVQMQLLRQIQFRHGLVESYNDAHRMGNTILSATAAAAAAAAADYDDAGTMASDRVVRSVNGEGKIMEC